MIVVMQTCRGPRSIPSRKYTSANNYNKRRLRRDSTTAEIGKKIPWRMCVRLCSRFLVSLPSWSDSVSTSSKWKRAANEQLVRLRVANETKIEEIVKSARTHSSLFSPPGENRRAYLSVDRVCRERKQV